MFGHVINFGYLSIRGGANQTSFVNLTTMLLKLNRTSETYQTDYKISAVVEINFIKII